MKFSLFILERAWFATLRRAEAPGLKVRKEFNVNQYRPLYDPFSRSKELIRCLLVD